MYCYTILETLLRNIYIHSYSYKCYAKTQLAYQQSGSLTQNGKVRCGHIVFGNYGHRALQLKQEKDHPDCKRDRGQKPASVMVWRCVSAWGLGNSHIWEGTMNAKRYVQDSEQHMLPLNLNFIFLVMSYSHQTKLWVLV